MFSKCLLAVCAFSLYANAGNPHTPVSVTYPPNGYTVATVPWASSPSAAQCKVGSGIADPAYGTLQIVGRNGKMNCDCLRGVCKASSCEVAFDSSSAGANCPVGAGNDDNCRNTVCVPWGLPQCVPSAPGGGERCFGTVGCATGTDCPNKGKLCLLDGQANANTFKNYKICSPDTVPSPKPSWSPARSPEPSPSPGDVPDVPTGDDECKCDDKYRNELCKKLESGETLDADNGILPSGVTSTNGYLSYTFPECTTLIGKADELDAYGCKPAAGCDTDWVCEKEVPLDYLSQLSADCGKIEHRTIIGQERRD